MNKEMFQKFIYFGVFLIFGFLFMLFPNNALAVEHDLRLRVISVRSIEGCRYLISVQIFVIGTNDYEIESGDVIIQILYKKNEEPWTAIDNIVVTKDILDIPFRQYAVWPNDFGSNENNTTIFDPPCDGTYLIKATIIYDQDQNLGNNERESSPEIVTCAGECPPPPVIPPVKDFCHEYPHLCRQIILWDLVPSINRFEGELEILFNNRINPFDLAVITRSGIIISKMEQLRKPIIVGKTKYNQRLKFFKSKDMVYHLMYWPTKETTVTEKLPSPILVRPLK